MLGVYYQCREAGDAILDEVNAETTELLNEFNDLTGDITCALELRDSIFAIYDEIRTSIYSRILALRVIRRECQSLPYYRQERCWIEFRIELLLATADTIRAARARQATYAETSLALLESYYQCREVQ